MAKLNLKDAPYMVASYVRCEDVRKLRTNINTARCIELFSKCMTGDKRAEAELRKEVEKILALEKRVFELERKTFLSNRNLNLSQMKIDEVFRIAVEFRRNSLAIEELENFIKATM